jgi:hypothetical protein
MEESKPCRTLWVAQLPRMAGEHSDCPRYENWLEECQTLLIFRRIPPTCLFCGAPTMREEQGSTLSRLTYVSFVLGRNEPCPRPKLDVVLIRQQIERKSSEIRLTKRPTRSVVNTITFQVCTNPTSFVIKKHDCGSRVAPDTSRRVFPAQEICPFVSWLEESPSPSSTGHSKTQESTTYPGELPDGWPINPAQ